MSHCVYTGVLLQYTRYQGTRIVVTLDLIFEVLHVPRVAHPDYPGCERLQTASRDELLSHFYKTPSIWGGKQNTPCSSFARGPRFLNMVMTFTLTPLSHYNSITEPCAHFLLSLLEDLSIDLPSHFITSVIDVYQDTMTRDKLIFPSAIMWILRHVFIPILDSPYFTTIGAINTGSVWRSEAQFRPKLPRTETTDHVDPTTPSSLAPSTSAPSSSAVGVTLAAIMVQLQHMDACLDFVTDEMCQVNTRVGRIA